MSLPRYDSSDEQLIMELKAAAAEERAVPPGAREAAQATFAWRTVDQELRTLLVCFDSAVNEGALARGPSSPSSPRSLSFEGDELGVEIEIHAGRLTGQLLPPQPGAVRVVSMAGVHAEVSADAAGCFVIDRPPNGPLRLECNVGGPILVTEWVSL